jgi:hypothetical protein
MHGEHVKRCSSIRALRFASHHPKVMAFEIVTGNAVHVALSTVIVTERPNILKTFSLRIGGQ